MEVFLLWKPLFFSVETDFSSIDNDMLEMIQRMALTYFDE